MVIDGPDRQALHRRLQELLGREHADILMTYLPDAPPATREDLQALEDRFDLKLAASADRILVTMHKEMGTLRSDVHKEIGTLRSDMASQMGAQTRTILQTVAISMVGSVATVGALAFAAARLV